MLLLVYFCLTLKNITFVRTGTMFIYIFNTMCPETAEQVHHLVAPLILRKLTQS